jgi:hypothetical protein
MEVAIRLAPEGWRFASAAIGFDVATLEVHTDSFPLSPHPYSVNKFLIFHQLTAHCSP